MEIAISDADPQGWRAAWILFHAGNKNDPRIIPFIDQIIEAIPDRNEGHQRELIKLLGLTNLSEDQEGPMVDICISLWETPSKIPSVRYMAFKFLVRMAKKYPELKNELDFFTQAHYLDSLTPGVQKSIQKLMRESQKKK